MTYEDYLKQLVGGTIEGLVVDSSEDENEEVEENLVYGYSITKNGKKFIAWIQCDEEGNGPGHLNIEEQKPGRRA